MDNSRDLDLEKQIDAYIKGRLNESEVDQLWIELLKRPDYIDLLETELIIKLIIEEQQAQEKEKGKETPAKPIAISRHFVKHSWKWLSAAATVAVLIIAINFFQYDTEQTIRQLTLGEINIVENLASPEVLRSQDTEITDGDSLLNSGFKAAISGEIDKALAIYKEVIDGSKDASHLSMAYLNLGIIEYNSENYEMASTAFKEAIDYVDDDVVLEEKAYWYLGNAYVNLDRFEEGREAIHKVYTMDGIYKKPANRLLQKLDEELGNVDSDKLEE